MKNKTFLDSILCAIQGIIAANKTEKNFKYYYVISLTYLILNIVLKSTVVEFAIWAALSFLVFALEMVNTAIERVVDKLGMEFNEDSKFIKDVAAGAVLMAGLAFLVAEGVILLSKLL